MRRLLAIGVALAGCNPELQLNLVINDPCNQTVLADPSLGIEHVELQIAAPDLGSPKTTVWSRDAGEGELDRVPPVSDATVSVLGRADNASGGPGNTLAAISVGLVDLTGQGAEDNTVDLHVVFGKVDHFFFTTDAERASGGEVVCTQLGAKRRGHTASLLQDGRVLIAGGRSRQGAEDVYWETTEFFDPVGGTYTQGPDMKWVREAHTATVLAGGRVLIAGGVGLNGPSLDTWRIALIYDAEADLFLPPVTLLAQRANHTATLLSDGRVLLAGGTLGASELDTTEIVTVTGDAATTCAGPRLRAPRAFHAAVQVGGSVVALIGGRGSGQVLASVEFITVDACRTDATLVVAGPDLSVARSHAMAALVSGADAVLVAGGFGTLVAAPEDGTGLRGVEVIRIGVPLTASTVACTTLELTTGRGAAAWAPVPGGFLLAGGVGDASMLHTTNELVTVNNLGACDVDFRTSAGDLGTARAGAVATILVGGDVLLSGGFARASGQVVSLGQGEIYVRAR